MIARISKKFYQYVNRIKKSDFWSSYGGIFLGLMVVLGIGMIIYSNQNRPIAQNVRISFSQGQNNLAQIPPWFNAGQATTKHILIPEKQVVISPTPAFANDANTANGYQSQGGNASLPFGEKPIRDEISSADDFKLKAGKGEGVTNLARRALGQYLESVKPAVSLTKEHKIYIEDYLRRANNKNFLQTGQELTFSRQIIEQAIQKAQQLSTGQLHNLTRYANRVPSLARYP